MARIVYVNGEFLAEDKALVSVFDRGFLFADAVYEVTSVLDGKLIDFDGHMARLRRSLGELGISQPLERDELLALHRELVERNEIQEGIVYLQISRGVADRDFAYPDVEPTVVLFTQHKRFIDSPTIKDGIKVITVEDNRWKRRDIKTVQLLYPSMAKMAALEAGADDAWLVEDGFITEGTSNNTYIVTDSGAIVTRELSSKILHGITRASVLATAKEAQMRIEERPFTVEEARNAAEAFITSATNIVVPVVELDGEQVGNGKPGPVADRLREIYLEYGRKSAI